eukprot:CAMPEP_0176173464 /NCGR_PEP_ID=MMETSP0120_2-20121206/88874_1 /TAXON_ID=160619 /ORGANISM="Kryptoperidinium foliaceum, Strain CCMP 1326" /LENGTH=495 /DNA_ID=CAMNT_0017511481 /DNA_START=113 /DNA_END=1599 /DNA_ORIENTATION=+
MKRTSAGTWLAYVLLLIPASLALASNQNPSARLSLRRIFGKVSGGGAQEINTLDATSLSGVTITETRPLKVLFLSADTGGGHRASAEALGKQFAIQFPGSTYELADLWTDHGVYILSPIEYQIERSLRQFSLESYLLGRLYKRIESHDPDVIVSVHPTMNHAPLRAVQKLSKKRGKHIPFFTVVTDLGSGHCMWFEKKVNKLYVASQRLYKLAEEEAVHPGRKNIVMAGLPIRHGFSVQAEKLGDRNSLEGKAYQKSIKEELGFNTEKPVVLVMGGGEGVGSLSDIVNQLYTKLTTIGVDATICVVCGRNEKLKADLETRDWDAIAEKLSTDKKRRRLFRFFGRKVDKKHMQSIENTYQLATETADENGKKGKGDVDVVGLGFITNMPEYMVAADVLVTKAGPGTIAEAASVGLPVMLTSYLPGQEAGNVDVVLESGYGDYCEEPIDIAKTVSVWLQDSELLTSLSMAAQRSGRPDAADEIVRDIGSQTVAWLKL